MCRIAIIPARGGSKRIPRKNIKEFCGKPVISYSIEAAIKSDLFDEIMVSTDDEEIAEIAKEYGAKVPWLRSKESSGDFSTLADVLKEEISKLSANGCEYDVVCCILPTAPFITQNNLIEANEHMENGNFDSVYPISEFSYPIQRALSLKNGLVYMTNPSFYSIRSQDIEPQYFDSGQFYFFRMITFIEKGEILTDNSSAIIVPSIRVQDIDTMDDWKLAEFKFKYLEQIS